MNYKIVFLSCCMVSFSYGMEPQVRKKTLIEAIWRGEEDDHGRTALHYAAQKGLEKVVNLLIDSNVPVNSSDNNGAMPLHIAVKMGRVEIVRLLLSRGANVNCSTTEKRVEPVHIASGKGYSKVLSVLVEHGANLYMKDEAGLTPLQYAATRDDNLETVRYLCEKMSVYPELYRLQAVQAFQRALLERHPDVADFLLTTFSQEEAFPALERRMASDIIRDLDIKD